MLFYNWKKKIYPNSLPLRIQFQYCYRKEFSCVDLQSEIFIMIFGNLPHKQKVILLPSASARDVNCCPTPQAPFQNTKTYSEEWISKYFL